MLSDFEFHHIGIATSNIEKTAKYYTDAGYLKTETVLDILQNVYICFLSKKNAPLLELVAPVDDTSPVSKILNKSGISPYHFCYEVLDIEEAIKRLRKLKFIPLSVPVEANAMNCNRICFLYNKDVGLIEIVEKK